MDFPVLLAILFFSIILHEVSHGAVAYAFGDPTARDAGRLTLNPLKHVDLFGSILLPAVLILVKSSVLIGWAKPVPFDPVNFKRPKLGIFTVSLAGPATNFLLAAFFAAPLRLYGAETPFARYWLYGVSVNVLLGLFNLVPIPPLDGSKALAMLLPTGAREAYLSLGRWGLLILVVLLYAGALSVFLLPAWRALLSALTGLPL